MKRSDLRRFAAQLRHPSLRGLFDIRTHLTSDEKLALFRLARGVAAGRDAVLAVEIGSYLGASSAFLAAGLAGRGQVLCIDTWQNDAMSEGGRDTMADFAANTRRFRDHIVPLRGWSTDPAVVAQVAGRGRGVDLLFIDGNHDHEAVLADWNAYAPMLASDAVVAMHDVGWAEGVQRVVAEQARPRVRSEGRLPNLWWGHLHP